MAREEILLDFSNAETYECGAMLLSVLAYPSVSAAANRRELQRSLCAGYLRAVHSDQADTTVIIPLKPAYVFRSERTTKKDIKTLERRLRDRAIAAHMFRGFWQQAAGAVISLPTGMTRLSLNELAEFVAEDAQLSSGENVETRIWRPSIPVIHIAAALENILLDSDRLGGRPNSWGDILTNRKFVEEIVRKAKHIEGFIGASAKIRSQLNLAPSSLVSVELAD
jgi:hypothetical protein